MKKSTLIKVLCIVLATLFALSLVACGGGNNEDDGEKVTVYFDPNGGTLEDGVPDEIQVTVGEKIGKLPTPVRPGYEFLGWFEDGNERWEITRKDEVEDEMELVALWSPLGDLVTVEFAVSSGETLNGDVLYVDIVKGQRINSALQTLPTASKDDYIFKGWKDASGITVTVTTKVEGDLVLYPVWERIVYCLDGTENHVWNAWQEATEATCTEDAKSSRVCGVCGHIEYNVTEPATGHKFGQWATSITENGIVRSRVCVECDEKEADPLTNIAYDSFKTPVIDGDCWGGDKGANLFDGNYADKPIAAKGTGALTVTIEAKEATYVDIIAVTGFGSAAYNVIVTYEDGTQKDLGVGAFGSGDSATKAFNVGKAVTKIVVTQPSPSNGTDYWSEISILVVPQ